MATLAVLVIGLAAWFVMPAAIHALDDRASAAADKTAMAAATAALSKVERPAGLAECAGMTHGVIPDVCWEGPGTPVAATAALRSSLERAGASAINARCVSTKEIEQVCMVDARLAGMDFHSMLSGPPITPIGVHVGAGLGPFAIPMPSTLPRYGTPLPIPAQ
jgi:hypothetical protein